MAPKRKPTVSTSGMFKKPPVPLGKDFSPIKKPTSKITKPTKSKYHLHKDRALSLPPLPSKTKAFDDVLETRTAALLATALTAIETTHTTALSSLSNTQTEHSTYLSTSIDKTTTLIRSLSDEKLEFKDRNGSVTGVWTLGERMRRFKKRVTGLAGSSRVEEEAVVEGLWREWEANRKEIAALRVEIFGHGVDGNGDDEDRNFRELLEGLRVALEDDVRAVGEEAVRGMVASERVMSSSCLVMFVWSSKKKG
ncbi:MAG: hypothetical protein MMC33_005363 [Icmadophila ericetorum]|nr:hypothetical protein [Icmadophila ericetorum]